MPTFAYFSPAAEQDLFGSPAPNPAGHKGFDITSFAAQSPTVIQLHKQHTSLLQQIKVHVLACNRISDCIARQLLVEDAHGMMCKGCAQGTG